MAEHWLEPGPMQIHLSANHLCSADRMANYTEQNQYSRNKSEHTVVIRLLQIQGEFLLFYLTFICLQG